MIVRLLWRTSNGCCSLRQGKAAKAKCQEKKINNLCENRISTNPMPWRPDFAGKITASLATYEKAHPAGLFSLADAVHLSYYIIGQVRMQGFAYRVSIPFFFHVSRFLRFIKEQCCLALGQEELLFPAERTICFSRLPSISILFFSFHCSNI
jgi:hypothetical protein